MTPVAQTLRPADAEELCELVSGAAQDGAPPLEIRAGGTKCAIGSPGRETTVVDIGKLRGIVAYEPSELVLTVRPATPLAEVEALLREQGQMLAFDPWDHGPLFGLPRGSATIGGVVAAGVAGPRRVSAGAARDHLLGFTAICGRGEVFKGGGKVVKNVTGYDLPKLMAGSWGQLAVLTEVTLKVAPRPQTMATVAVQGLTADSAVAAMSKAMGAPCAVSAAAHLPARGHAQSVTGLRVEGFSESVEARANQLLMRLADFGDPFLMPREAADGFWTIVLEARCLHDSEALWRVHVAASRAAALTEELAARGACWLFDWAGALIWAGAPAATDVRGATESFGGHAMLLRAPLTLRQTVPARHPEASPVAALSARVKQAFDPAGILDPRRFD